MLSISRRFRISSWQTPVWPQRSRPTCVLSEVFRTYHSALSRPPLAANARVHTALPLYLNVPLYQQHGTVLPRWVHLSVNRCREPQSSSFVGNFNSNCSTHPPFYVGRPSILCRRSSCVEQSTFSYTCFNISHHLPLWTQHLPLPSQLCRARTHFIWLCKVPLQRFRDSVTIIMYILNNNNNNNIAHTAI